MAHILEKITPIPAMQGTIQTLHRQQLLLMSLPRAPTAKMQRVFSRCTTPSSLISQYLSIAMILHMKLWNGLKLGKSIHSLHSS